MVKKFTAHINLASPGEHEFLAPVSFDHGRSVALRIQEIRLRPNTTEKPYKVPLNLLTWFTEHAAAGREISRDDNKQQNEASLFTNQALLREQIETFSIKKSFQLEVDITELDQNDESCIRDDQGVMIIEVNLFYGPKAKCTLALEPLVPTVEQNLLFPKNCSGDGRFDLVQATVKSNLGPLDPRSDKRLLLCTVKLSDTWQSVRNALIERLCLYEGEQEQPSEYIEDEHHYIDIYKSFPHAQDKNFPKGAKAFGPFLPSAPKEKRGPWTISLNAPLNDPFWLQIANVRAANNNQPLRGIIELIIPEPGGNIKSELKFAIQFDDNDWVIITDGTAKTAPLLLPVNRNQTTEKVNEIASELTLAIPEMSLPASHLLSVQYYGFGLSDGPVNIALTPSKKDTEFYTVKPEVSEVSDHQRQIILLNNIAVNKKLKIQKSEFQVKCFWPDKQQTETYIINIKLLEKSYSQALSVDIGSHSIALASIKDKKISNLPLGNHSQINCVSEDFIPSRICLSGRIENIASDEYLGEQNWHVKNHPLSISFDKTTWKPTAIEDRLSRQNRSYDIALPIQNEIKTGVKSNLKKIFSQSSATEDGALTSKDQIENSEESKSPPRFLTATRQKTDDSGDNSENASFETEAYKTGLVSSLDPSLLMADCLDELYNFYGTYFNKRENAPIESGKSQAGKLNKHSNIVLTHSAHLSATAKRRYRDAGAGALANFEQGSFKNMGPLTELIGLQNTDQLKTKVTLVNETLAASYHSLKQMAEQEQPARAKKIEQIHIDIGESNVSLIAQTGWIGETNAYVENVLGNIDLPFGAHSLELALIKEISQYLELATGAGAQIIQQGEFPTSVDEIRKAQNEQNEIESGHFQILENLRSALYQSETTKDRAGNDLHICLGSGEQGEALPFTLAASVQPSGEPISLWHGLRGEQLVCVSEEDGKNWRIELRIEIDALAQRVGPLSTYLAFVAELLPRSIEQVFPSKDTRVEKVFSVSGGGALFTPFKKLIEQTAKNLDFRILPLPKDYKSAKTPTSLGALELFHYQNCKPFFSPTPNVMLVPLSDKAEGEGDMIAVAEKGKLVIIDNAVANGTLPPTCTTIQLIETLPGFGSLMSKDPTAVYCQTYLDDLDRATTEQWAVAASEWQIYLDQCYKTMLNMPVESTGDNEQSKGQDWGFKTLKKDEAQLTIAGKTFWVSAGLFNSAQ